MGLGKVVWVSALVSFLARFPSLLWPLRPDEAGFLLVARAWHPRPDSVYGHYWVDRPPPVIALMKLTDWAGGPYAHRMVGALACSLLVLAAAVAARELAWRAGVPDPLAVRRVGGWVAVATAAMVANAQIDPLGAKGELFGIPMVMASSWLALRAVRRRATVDAFWAGLLAVLAVGMKQSIVGGLVLGGVLLVGSALARSLPGRTALRLGAAAVAGGLVPVLTVVSWALVAGVRMRELWYTVVGFRSDASAVLASQQAEGPASRIVVLLLIFVGVGMLFVVLLLAIRLRALVRHDPVVAVAVVSMLAVDLGGVAVSGSYWTPYLFVPIPSLALALGAVLALDRTMSDTERPRRGVSRLAPYAVVGATVVSSVLALGGWTIGWVAGRVPVEVRTGEGIAAAARPGDDVLVYGGRADIQWASGTGSPYPYLWSLPMRTLDPGLKDLRSVLTGPDGPTWFVEATYINNWSEIGTRPIERHLLSRYELVGTACHRYRVYHLNTVDPVDLDVDCSTPYRTIWGR